MPCFLSVIRDKSCGCARDASVDQIYNVNVAARAVHRVVHGKLICGIRVCGDSSISKVLGYINKYA